MTNKEIEISPTRQNNKNDVKVNNQFSLTLNFGDSLNLLALIAGFYMIRKIGKRYKVKKKDQKASS
ncbi:hypothetical protein BIV60_08620 [Bacillus sp. MUM 116]|uniref:hypothetical protein n=1 Tax=Bacillus sp. MUM 116 TaxID=1678002 RepID=UPI0008F5ED3A|nr:hypothetical protein [Bacillus sp. MUM 116]OIK15599.1 hypothetical protein BIV60_08620 [Bacillus sp. MUM 116]